MSDSYTVRQLARRAPLAAVSLALAATLPSSALADQGPWAPPGPERLDAGRAIMPELPASVTLTIDGSAADWPSEHLSVVVTPIGSGPSGSGRMVIDHPTDLMAAEELHVFFEIVDASEDAGPDFVDDIVLMFDLSHDHDAASAASYPEADDRGIRFGRDGSVDHIFGDPVSPTLCVDAGSQCDEAEFGTVDTEVQSAGGQWTLEATIRPSDLGLNGFAAVMGATAFVKNDDGANPAQYGRWPATAEDDDPATWFNLITREPIDYVVVADRSGSMSGDKWDSVRRAGNHFALILKELRDPDLDAEYAALGVDPDQIGLATFHWSGGADQSAESRALDAIASAPDDYTSSLPDSPGGLTPIGGGLKRAFQMMDVTTDPGALRTRKVILLTDGKHNRPDGTLDLTSTDEVGYVPPTPAASVAQVNPVAIGTDLSVDTDLLAEIEDVYGGAAFREDETELAKYNVADASTEQQLTAQLTTFFVETMLHDFHVNRIAESTTGAPIPEVSIKAGERKLLFFAFWANRSDAVPLQVTAPDGSTLTGTADTDLGYSYLVLDDPQGGGDAYTDFEADGANYLTALVDLRVEARFGIDAARHGTGDDVIVRAWLREDGRPIPGADVRVDEGYPEESLGTLASTISLARCQRVEPRLQAPPDSASDVLFADSVPASAVAPAPGRALAARRVPAVAARAQDPDPGSYLYRWGEAYLGQCGQGVLPRDSDTGLRLLDDGTNGDAVADDGIYTRRITNTEEEGSYVFRFSASGTTPTGHGFQRTQHVAEYVGFKADPGASEFGSRFYDDRDDDLVLYEHYIIPQDAFENYLGPDRSRHVEFVQVGGGGAITSDVVDHGDGVYSVLSRHDASSERRPVVVPVVRGDTIRPPDIDNSAELFLSYADFADALGVNSSLGFGLRASRLLAGTVRGGFELGATVPEWTNDDVTVVQLLGTLSADLPVSDLALVPFVTAGAGLVVFDDETDDDAGGAAGALSAGGGAAYFLTDGIAVRATGQALWLSDVRGAGGTTVNPHFTLGLEFRR